MALLQWSQGALCGAAFCTLSACVLWGFYFSDDLLAGGLADSVLTFEGPIARRHELHAFLQTLRTKGEDKNGPGYTEFRFPVLRNYSASQINNFVTDFGVPNLNSEAFKQHFLVCTGQTLAKQFVNFTDKGKVVMPKHFQTCKSMSFQKTGKTVVLLSFPGSGNSWVRQLIEMMTGIYTGTYEDCDESYISYGMIGEGIFTDNVIAVKIHYPREEDLKWLYQHNIIYVVRNPFNAILAEWNRKMSVLKDSKTAHISSTTDFGK